MKDLLPPREQKIEEKKDEIKTGKVRISKKKRKELKNSKSELNQEESKEEEDSEPANEVDEGEEEEKPIANKLVQPKEVKFNN